MRSRRGNAAIEFALVFGLLWLLLSGVFRLGYSMYLYHRLLGAVAEAARYASRVTFDPGHTFVPAVRNMAVYGQPTTGTAPLAPGLAVQHIAVTWTTDASGMPLTITVAVSGYTADALFQTFTWDGKPSATVRFCGRWIT
ncbi:MAG: TadE/TadG family type IV pilus assembly protein [Bryobacteraceae bacterium]